MSHALRLHRKPVPTRARASSSIATSERVKSLNWNFIFRVGNKLMMHANRGSQQRIIPMRGLFIFFKI
jgi:hypothetical protein